METCAAGVLTPQSTSVASQFEEKADVGLTGNPPEYCFDADRGSDEAALASGQRGIPQAGRAPG